MLIFIFLLGFTVGTATTNFITAVDIQKHKQFSYLDQTYTCSRDKEDTN